MQKVKTWLFGSSSSNKTYETVLWEDGTMSCNCPGWTFKKSGQDRTCKHILGLGAQIGAKAKAEGPQTVEKIAHGITLEAVAPKVKKALDQLGIKHPYGPSVALEAMAIASRKNGGGVIVPPFFKPMLAQPTEHGFDWAGAAYIAEPKYDGKRALLYVRDHKTAICYSRLGNPIGDEWLKEITWPFESATLDGEMCAGDGLSTGGKDIKHAKSHAGQASALVLFDLIEFEGLDLKATPWTVRRETLEHAFRKFKHARVDLTPTSADAKALWKQWVERMGGEGIMLKDKASAYVPGWRSPHWIKVKFETTVDVVVTGTTDKATYNGGKGYVTGEVALTYGYYDPATGQFETVGQGIKVGKKAELEKLIGQIAEMTCKGVTVTGALKSGHFVKWRTDKAAKECTKPGA